MVIATQNPIDLDGTYRLPEAQLDRFLVRTSLGYPDAEHEIEVLRPGSTAGRIDQVDAVTTPEEVAAQLPAYVISGQMVLSEELLVVQMARVGRHHSLTVADVKRSEHVRPLVVDAEGEKTFRVDGVVGVVRSLPVSSARMASISASVAS
jgi:MoxR-like ATPase